MKASRERDQKIHFRFSALAAVTHRTQKAPISKPCVNVAFFERHFCFQLTPFLYAYQWQDEESKASPVQFQFLYRNNQATRCVTHDPQCGLTRWKKEIKVSVVPWLGWCVYVFTASIGGINKCFLGLQTIWIWFRIAKILWWDKKHEKMCHTRSWLQW